MWLALALLQWVAIGEGSQRYVDIVEIWLKICSKSNVAYLCKGSCHTYHEFVANIVVRHNLYSNSASSSENAIFSVCAANI